MNAALVVQLLLQGLTQIQQYGALLAKMHAEGRSDLTDEEVLSVAAADDAARARLQALIDARK